jgi:major membrane immunogen (membrane-anchored lipoprotein)
MRRVAGVGWVGVPALLAAVLVVGCSGGEGRVTVHPVKGKATVAGAVPEGALVVFYPAPGAAAKDLRPSGKVTKDGSFTLTTYDADDGAPAGDYTATIQWNKLIKQGGDYKAGPDVIPGAYGSPEKSTWKVKVASGPNELPPLDIKK